MPRTRIRSDQEQDISFVSEEELNEFFGKTVITGTVDSTAVLEDFDTFFPGRGLILSEGQVIVATGTNFITISGGDASGDDIDNLQVQIDALVFEQAGVGSITASGVTLSGAIVLEGDGTVSLHPSGQTIVISGSGAASTITNFLGVGEVVVTTEGDTVVISGTPHTEDTDTVSNAIIGGENITVVSGANTTTISSPDTIDDALVGAGEVVVTSGVSTITISGTPHPPDDDDVDSLTASGTTVTGSVLLESIGGISIIADDTTDTVTISGGPEIGSNIGNFFQVEFSSVGITNNTWLAVSSKDLTSNITPWPVVFPCRIAGLGYSNERSDSTVNLDLHVSPSGSGNSSVVEFTWAISGSRTAYKSDFGLSEIVLNPGDKVALFGDTSVGGTKPKNMFLGLFVEIIARDDAEDSETYAGDFS